VNPFVDDGNKEKMNNIENRTGILKFGFHHGVYSNFSLFVLARALIENKYQL